MSTTPLTSSSVPLTLTEFTTNEYPTSSSLNPDYYVRELVMEAMRKESNITSFYEEQMRNILALFNSIVVKMPAGDIRTVKCIPGTPERAIGKATKDNNLVLPIIGIEQLETSEEQDQRKYTSLVTTQKMWDKDKQRAVRVVGLIPKAISITYEVSVWTKYKQDMDQIVEQVQRMFNPSIDVNNPFTQYGKIFLDSETNNSISEAGDGENRVLSRVFSLVVETHLPSPKFLMTSSGKLERIYLEGEIYSEPRTL